MFFKIFVWIFIEVKRTVYSQKYKAYGSQKTTQKIKDKATRSPQKPGATLVYKPEIYILSKRNCIMGLFL